MLTIVIVIASVLADLAVGMAAFKMAKSAAAAQAANTATDAKLLEMSTKQQDQINNHEYRIVILERKAG